MLNLMVLVAVVGIIGLVLKQFQSHRVTATHASRSPRLRSIAAALDAPGETPYYLGTAIVSPGAPLVPPNQPAGVRPTPPVDRTDHAPPRPVDPAADAETLFAEARELQAQGNFAAALPVWQELSNRREARRFQAEAWVIRCLFELGRGDEARFRYAAPDASRDTLEVAGQFLVLQRQWEEGLAIWRRLHTGLEEQRAEASFYIATCLLQLDRLEEAEALYTGRNSTVDALKAACDYFHQQQAWVRVLPMWQRLQKTSMKFGRVARAGQVECHLEMGAEQEARTLYESERATVDVVRAAAMFFYTHNRRDEARGLFQRIGQLTDSEDEAVTAAEYAVRCERASG